MTKKQISPALRMRLQSLLSSHSAKSAQELGLRPQNKSIQKEPKMTSVNLDSVKSLVNKALKSNSAPTTQHPQIQRMQVSEDSLQTSLATNQSLTNLLLGAATPPSGGQQ
jgi:endoglucanase Acf2